MKKIQTIIVASVLVMGMVLSGPVFADRQGKGGQRGFGVNQRHKGGGLMLLAKYQQKNLMIEVLSEMTGQTTEAISTKFKEQRPRTVMQDLNIDRQAFRTAMHAKVSERVKKAVADGTITSEQEQDILEKMENRSKRREIMSRLIEKGIEDGSLSQEDAQTLLPKRR
jgi:hypothetical protein